VGEYKRFFRLGLGRSRDLQQELDQEIETHIALRVEDLVAGGMSPDAAREEVLQRFGDLQSARSDLYSSARRREGRFRLRALVDDVRCDLRLSLRQARRVPGYSAVAVAIFAVAIGLTTSMFTVVDHVLLRPLPFPDPEQLVALESVQENGEPLYLVSMANWVDWHGGNSTLTSSAIYRTQRVTVGIGDEVLRAEGTTVAGGFFETIRPRMDAGRPFSEQDAEQEAPVVVLSHAFASRTFAGAPPVDALLLVDGQERRVIGVTARGGQIPDGAELWIPRRARPGSGGLRNNINWRSVARIADGVDASVVEADGEMRLFGEARYTRVSGGT
jgi:putative ABC transport system permease protein